MPRYSTAQAQRARHQLNREALKRSHRRGDLIRALTDAEPDALAPPPVDEVAATGNPATRPRA